MRTLLIGLGLAGLFAAGCGSSTTVDGGTTTGGGTTGTATAGTTSGTTTTGGTTTGTGGLPAGASCSSNASCTSAICGVTGVGHCCTAQCSTTDAVCGASDCDDTGACTYPASGTNCGASCNAGMFAASTCDGSGTCVPGTPAACPANLGCNSTTMFCNTTCAVAGDCVTGFYCNAGSCVAQMANGACTTNDACTSGICGLSGTGNCCTTQCTAASDLACNPGCDATTGACTYPAGNTCGAAATCSGGMLTASTCDATGACNSATVACANNFGCNAAGTACNTTCTVASDCASGFWCNVNACVAQMATGACTEDDACTSGVCGTNGSGNCCTAACTVGDPTCGATGCDATGACMYPAATLACGTTTCTNGTLTSSACNGTGTCVANGDVACPSGACNSAGTGCSCASNSDCSGNTGVCDVANSTCCTAIAASGAMSVDSATGSDQTACCGYNGAGACQTITQAMKLIDGAQATNVKITATVSGAGGDWAPLGETYPIKLGWGVELSAPGVFFLDPNGGNVSIIDVAQYSANDNVGYASIVGTAANQVGIGMNQANTQQLSDNAAIQVEGSPTSQTLFIADAVVNGSAANGSAAFNVIAGGTLTLGGDQSSLITGTVNIGNALNNAATDGWDGILCGSDFASLGCTINDVALVKQNSVVIQGQEAQDLVIQDFATVSLTSAPVIGTAPAAAGFNQCNAKPDAQNGSSAIGITGPATVTFNNGTIQCISGTAIGLQTSEFANGAPTLNMDTVTIQNTALGIYASGGTATVTNTTINYNFIGVQQDHNSVNSIDGTIDLTGGGNTVICSSNQETGSGNEGIDVYNTSQSNLAADNVAWDTTSPDYFSCDSDSSTATCTCLIASCSQMAPFDDMDAVEDSTNLGGITTTGNTQSASFCN